MSDMKQESRVRVDLTAVVIAMQGGEPNVLTVERSGRSTIALPSGPLQPGHRSLQAGLRSWVEQQTECRLGYVEQLYTFGDRAAGEPDGRATIEHRAVSIAYLALVPSASEERPLQGRWRRWYDFFPWEDMREGEPAARPALLERLLPWARERQAGERLRLTFGLGEASWDEERALERYELLYGAGLVAEAYRDKGVAPPATVTALPGIAMFADHRRILATAVSRLRAKIKYRPVLFELMPETFTLSALQRTAEALTGVPLHKQNFRRLVASQGLVEETGGVETETGGRPAKLVRFRREVTLERPAPGVRLGATRRGSFP